jgi:hypothetical protein
MLHTLLFINGRYVTGQLELQYQGTPLVSPHSYNEGTDYMHTPHKK